MCARRTACTCTACMFCSQTSAITLAIPTERMRCLKHPLLRGRARLLWACAIVYTVVFQPVRLLLFREVSLLLALSLARSLSLARRARTLSPYCFPDRQAHLAERPRESARAREGDTDTHTHACTLTRTHTSQRSVTGYDRARKGLVAGEWWDRSGGSGRGSMQTDPKSKGPETAQVVLD